MKVWSFAIKYGCDGQVYTFMVPANSWVEAIRKLDILVDMLDFDNYNRDANPITTPEPD